MIKVVWDNSLPPCKEETEIERWDRWFPLVGLSAEWEEIKAIIADDAQRCSWARIMELNRISTLSSK